MELQLKHMQSSLCMLCADHWQVIGVKRPGHPRSGRGGANWHEVTYFSQSFLPSMTKEAASPASVYMCKAAPPVDHHSPASCIHTDPQTPHPFIALKAKTVLSLSITQHTSTSSVTLQHSKWCREYWVWAFAPFRFVRLFYHGNCKI